MVSENTFYWAKLFSVACFLLALCLWLGGCSSGIVTELAKDPATVSVHQVVIAPGWSVTTDYVRNNSTGASASAGTNGITASIPNGSTQATPPGPAVSTTTAH